MTYWKAQHFKALQKLWYQRLEESGFQDAEKLVDDQLLLRQTAAHKIREMNALARQQKADYFNALCQNMHHAEFHSEIDRMILTMYSEGKKIKVICEELEKIGEKRCRNTITFTIRKYEMRWGMKTYTPKQLNKASK